jgi:hypothetical protein
VEQVADCCILAAVGQQMASRKGVSATMFSALAKANINVRCAQIIWGLGFRASPPPCSTHCQGQHQRQVGPTRAVSLDDFVVLQRLLCLHLSVGARDFMSAAMRVLAQRACI